MMPGALNPAAAQGFNATYQFDISGSENFTAHLVIADGQATFHEGPAEHPSITIKTPAEVWLAIARRNGRHHGLPGRPIPDPGRPGPVDKNENPIYA